MLNICKVRGGAYIIKNMRSIFAQLNDFVYRYDGKNSIRAKARNNPKENLFLWSDFLFIAVCSNISISTMLTHFLTRKKLKETVNSLY